MSIMVNTILPRKGYYNHYFYKYFPNILNLFDNSAEKEYNIKNYIFLGGIK